VTPEADGRAFAQRRRGQNRRLARNRRAEAEGIPLEERPRLVSKRSLTSVLRFVLIVLRWVAVAFAVLVWVVVVPLVDMLWSLLTRVARRLRDARRSS
jgi:hypothetical protein